MLTERTNFLQVEFDGLAMSELLAEMSQVTPETPFRYVVTPNVDHVVRLHGETEEAQLLGSAYAAASYCVCDSRILAGLAKLRGLRLSVIPGSDLTKLLFDEVIRPGDRVALVGGDSHLSTALSNRYPGVEFVQQCPPMGLLKNEAARAAAAEFVATAKARFTFICVGSPQQELIAVEAAAIGASGGVALCVGAALDFLADRQKRAPVMMRKLGLEWLHRLSSNPRRLWRRYLVEGPKIFALVLRWRRNST